MHEFPNLALELIDQFQEDANRESTKLNFQKFSHILIISKMLEKCDGCAHCAHHADVDELIDHWQSGDMKFFCGSI